MTVQDWLGADNQLGIDIWEKKYRYNNESFDEWLNRVSGNNRGLKRLIIEKKFLFGGRTLANRGTGKKGSFSNCYSIGYVPDDLNGILDVNTKIGMTFKAQGGQGLSLSKLRPKGTTINGQFKSDGIEPFMEIFNTTTSSISQGGCIDEFELVQTESGYKYIKDIKVGDKVWTKIGFISVDAIWDKGEQECYKITTSKGYEIITTRDHKFCIDGFNNKERLEALDIGDKINIIAGHCGQLTAFNPLSYLIGAYIANGYINRKGNSGNISTAHSDIAECIAECIKAIGFDCKIKKCSNVYRVILNSKVSSFIKNTIYKKNAYDVTIPEYVMHGDDNIVLSCIAGLIDGDGISRNTSIKYSTVCHYLATQVHKLFSRIGLFPSIHYIDRVGKHTLYEITASILCNTPNIPMIKPMPSSVKNSRYSTPYTKINSKIPSKSAEHLSKISATQYIGLYTYLQIKDAPYTPMIYDTICNIQYCGHHHVYDISLEKEHLFNCNGIYVSNSRKGALLMSLDIWHKEAEKFITIKSKEGKIEKANLSLEIDDEFMSIVDNDYKNGTRTMKTVTRDYEGNKITYEVYPIDLYKLMMKTVYDWGEPGCIFTNRFRNYNLMQYCDDYQIETCNP